MEAIEQRITNQLIEPNKRVPLLRPSDIYEPTRNLEIPFYIGAKDYNRRQDLKAPDDKRKQDSKAPGRIIRYIRNEFGPKFPILNPYEWKNAGVDYVFKEGEAPAGSLETSTYGKSLYTRRRVLKAVGALFITGTLAKLGLDGYRNTNTVLKKVTGNKNYDLLKAIGEWLIKGPEMSAVNTEISADIISGLLSDQRESGMVKSFAKSLVDIAAEEIKKNHDFGIDKRNTWGGTAYEALFKSIYTGINTLLTPRDRNNLKEAVVGLTEVKTIDRSSFITAMDKFNETVGGKVISKEDLLKILKEHYGYNQNDLGFVSLVYDIGSGNADPATGGTSVDAGLITGLMPLLNYYLKPTQ